MRPASLCDAIQVVGVAGVLLLGTASGAQGEATLVSDIGDGLVRSLESFYLDRANNAEFAGVLYFFNDDGAHGYELWRTDGTLAGTQIVVDLCPGACGSTTSEEPRRIITLGDALIFAATDGIHGVELWKSDGTNEGTRLLRDILPGIESSFPGELTSAAGMIFFTADDGEHGRELWVTNGLQGGTRMVADLSSPPASTSMRTSLEFDGALVFSGYAEGAAGLWRSDGTPTGTFRIAEANTDVLPGTAMPTLAELNGHLYFLARDETYDVQLWRSDGNVGDSLQISGEVEGYRLEAAGSQVFIVGDSELWRSDGTALGTWRIPLSDGAWPTAFGNRLITIGNQLFFSAFDWKHGLEPWVSDGFVAERLADIRPGPDSSLDAEPYWNFNSPFFTRAGGKAIFFANNGVHGLEPWYSNGTGAGTALLADFTPGPSSSRLDDLQVVRPPLALGDEALFVLRYESRRLLVKVDSAAAGALAVAILDAQTSAFALQGSSVPFRQNPWIGECFVPLGSGLLLSATVLAMGQEPWFSDGFGSGTGLVDDLFPGDFSGHPFACTAWRGRGIFQASFFESFNQPLLSTNGEPGSTEVLVETVGYLERESFAGLGDLLYIATGGGIVTTTGEPTGTQLLTPTTGNELERFGASLLVASEPIWISTEFPGVFAPLTEPGAPSWSIRLTTAEDRAFFFGWTEAQGHELWVTDGTPQGTHLVREIGTGNQSATSVFDFYLDGPRRASLTPLGGTVYFYADDGAHGSELWASDGTFDGTRMVRDIINGSYPSSPRELVRFGTHVYFVAESHGKGRELWRTDGTEQGTELVVDLVKGPGSSLPENLHAAGSELYFSAWTPARGREAWRIRLDGSKNPQPVPLDEIAPGALSSSPQIFREIGGTVFTVANDNLHGFELWTLREDDVVFSDGFEGTTTALWEPAP